MTHRHLSLAVRILLDECKDIFLGSKRRASLGGKEKLSEPHRFAVLGVSMANPSICILHMHSVLGVYVHLTLGNVLLVDIPRHTHRLS